MLGEQSGITLCSFEKGKMCFEAVAMGTEEGLPVDECYVLVSPKMRRTHNISSLCSCKQYHQVSNVKWANIEYGIQVHFRLVSSKLPF